MKEITVGIMIPIFNRSHYVEQCFKSLKESQHKLPRCILCLIDDGSSSQKTKDLIRNFHLDSVPIIKIFKPMNVGMWHSMRMGLDLLADYGCEHLINLDSDTIVKPDWVLKISDLLTRFPNNIASGFKVSGDYNLIETHKDYYLKYNTGGVSQGYTKAIYLAEVRGHLTSNLWDVDLGKAAKNNNWYYYVTNPSVVQHIGRDGVNCRPGILYDCADDF